ncbi:uncharacterized protein LOC109405035 isoform X3 [Aedes albopictus]|uniref:Secreted protein n=1 Tax=Aedes albopictus TaxID=7160 RepID=A0ABM1YF03_AEDAL
MFPLKVLNTRGVLFGRLILPRSLARIHSVASQKSPQSFKPVVHASFVMGSNASRSSNLHTSAPGRQVFLSVLVKNSPKFKTQILKKKYLRNFAAASEIGETFSWCIMLARGSPRGLRKTIHWRQRFVGAYHVCLLLRTGRTGRVRNFLFRRYGEDFIFGAADDIRISHHGSHHGMNTENLPARTLDSCLDSII